MQPTELISNTSKCAFCFCGVGLLGFHFHLLFDQLALPFAKEKMFYCTINNIWFSSAIDRLSLQARKEIGWCRGSGKSKAQISTFPSSLLLISLLSTPHCLLESLAWELSDS